MNCRVVRFSFLVSLILFTVLPQANADDHLTELKDAFCGSYSGIFLWYGSPRPHHVINHVETVEITGPDTLTISGTGYHDQYADMPTADTTKFKFIWTLNTTNLNLTIKEEAPQTSQLKPSNLYGTSDTYEGLISSNLIWIRTTWQINSKGDRGRLFLTAEPSCAGWVIPGTRSPRVKAIRYDFEN